MTSLRHSKLGLLFKAPTRKVAELETKPWPARLPPLGLGLGLVTRQEADTLV